MEPVTPGSAMLESAGRTVVKLIAGWLVAYAVAWGAKYGLEINESFNDVAFNALWGLATVGVSAIQRKVWPVKTDAAGVGRTDVTAGGKVI
jgi:hypothetical protein